MRLDAAILGETSEEPREVKLYPVGDLRGLVVESVYNEAGTSVKMSHLPSGTVLQTIWMRSWVAAREQAVADMERALAEQAEPQRVPPPQQ